MDYYEWYEILKEQDPDVVFADLRISTEELLQAFPFKVKQLYEEEWG